MQTDVGSPPGIALTETVPLAQLGLVEPDAATLGDSTVACVG
jgi:hypothetical protein